MTATIRWNGTLTAQSSIAHAGETRGTMTMLRREIVIQPNGQALNIPIISGNAFRGRLRRIGEELLRDVLQYEGELSLPVAHALRGGGSLTKTAGTPLSGQRLQQLRILVPLIGVFGCAGGGRIIDGALKVGKVVPHFAETAHLVPDIKDSGTPAFRSTQLETYTRQDDSSDHSFATVTAVKIDPEGFPEQETSDTQQLMLYRIETFPAGTIFSTWIQLDRASDLEISFFKEVLEAFATRGHIGGRNGRGMGQVTSTLEPAVLSGSTDETSWRWYVAHHREEAMAALEYLK